MVDTICFVLHFLCAPIHLQRNQINGQTIIAHQLDFLLRSTAIDLSQFNSCNSIRIKTADQSGSTLFAESRKSPPPPPLIHPPSWSLAWPAPHSLALDTRLQWSKCFSRTFYIICSLLRYLAEPFLGLFYGITSRILIIFFGPKLLVWRKIKNVGILISKSFFGVDNAKSFVSHTIADFDSKANRKNFKLWFCCLNGIEIEMNLRKASFENKSKFKIFPLNMLFLIHTWFDCLFGDSPNGASFESTCSIKSVPFSSSKRRINVSRRQNEFIWMYFLSDIKFWPSFWHCPCFPMHSKCTWTNCLRVTIVQFNFNYSLHLIRKLTIKTMTLLHAFLTFFRAPVHFGFS